MRISLFFLLIFFSISVYAAEWEKVGSRGMMEFVVIAQEKEADIKFYIDVINSICIPGQFCHVMFWTSKNHVPSLWPMTEEQRDAMNVEYFYNANSNEEKYIWNCRIIDDDECFSGNR